MVFLVVCTLYSLMVFIVVGLTVCLLGEERGLGEDVINIIFIITIAVIIITLINDHHHDRGEKRVS